MTEVERGVGKFGCIAHQHHAWSSGRRLEGIPLVGAKTLTGPLFTISLPFHLSICYAMAHNPGLI